jgi:hypothetical protein
MAYSTLKMERYIPPKRRLTYNGLHGVISQKTILVVFTVDVLFRFKQTLMKSIKKTRLALLFKCSVVVLS